MFKRLASEALGLSDLGIIVSPQDYDKVDADDYLFHEDNEKIYFLIKSKKDEYCFTNLALIHVDGDSAVSSKRAIRRYDYSHHFIDNVSIETAGTIDRDVELKFTLLDVPAFSIDVRKNQLEQLKDIYKALHTIGRIQHRNAQARENVLPCLQALGAMHKITEVESEATLVKHYQALLHAVNTMALDRYHKRDFGDVFEKYLRS
ncbi:PH domain-containing protein [Roseateles amylovorans]|uniref:PH domain-containing protein n=1 Tax=Roseateles amylovorans TaxID=2978473 RepID=A0ABY6AZD7_9BURK|nr:PH domain-containing protein [Roseateles amylovorans]UXH78541.1 PH domain-containing protein [Roseateles amylovorans]